MIAKSFLKQRYPVSDYFRVIFMGLVILLAAVLVKLFSLTPHYNDTAAGIDNSELSYSGLGNDSGDLKFERKTKKSV